MNLPVPLDRRVWLECQALRAAGYEVSVICPKGPGDPAYAEIDGVHIFKYAPAPPVKGVVGYAWEFAYGWVRTAALSRRVWKQRPFHLLQSCNPPDTMWLLARLWRPRGVLFVFDQHDLNPELFLSRFGTPQGALQKALYGGLLFLEAQMYRAAVRVISTNESYKRVAVERGGFHPDDVVVVRSGPDTRQMRPLYPETPVGGRTFTLAYLGIMGPQDGVDTILQVMDELVHRRGRRDVRAVLMGFGDCLDDLKRQSTRLGLDDVVEFTGRVGKDEIADRLSSADVGLCPDLKTPLNDVSTMNKTMEYMAYALPAVSFDLVETRVSGGDAVLYVPSGDVLAFADAVERLLDDPELRVELGLRARERVARELDWRPQARAYVGVYDALVGLPPREEPPADVDLPTAAVIGGSERRYVDLADTAELSHYIRERQPRDGS
ncbi:MAG: glycosyltransferase family 4 protein [Actinomycetes bacterium]